MNSNMEARSDNSTSVLTQRRANGRTGEQTISKPLGNGHTVADKSDSKEIRKERENLVLWKRPAQTLNYFFKELTCVFSQFVNKLSDHRILVAILTLVSITIFTASKITGPHQPMFALIYKNSSWCLYWLGLGVLSSVGLGTGLHTFLLYLGPHIASVTLAAYECEALNFPEPPYPDQILCPPWNDPKWAVSLWNIMRKVKVEAVMWGAGTALGELPPYFMARAARLSGHDPDEDDDEELLEFEELQKKIKDHPDSMTLLDKAKLAVENLVNKVGFFGILACASIPNPLFDLAGITCGHFLIPFWTFFGATLIGKAVIKMMIQVLFVIVAFNETLIERVLSMVSHVPLVGQRLQEPIINFLKNQKKKLHSRVESHSQSMVALIFEGLVVTMVLYFFVSIVNSMAQNYHKRLHRMREEEEKLKANVST